MQTAGETPPFLLSDRPSIASAAVERQVTIS
jgi:hypothetical protein